MIVVSVIRLSIETVEANADGLNADVSPSHVEKVVWFGATYASIPVIFVPYVYVF